MKLFRTILIGLSALIAVGCGGDSVQSPDFTPVLQSLTIQPQNPAEVPAGRTQQFTAIGTYTLPPGSNSATEDRPVSGASWTVSNANASIDGNGLATALLEGTVEIGASFDGVSATDTATLTIGPAVLESISIDPSPAPNISLGNSQEFTATGTYSDGTTAPVSVDWESSNTGVATVDPAVGDSTTATSVAEGTTTITATSGDLEDSVTLTVGPFEPTLASLTVAPDPGISPEGRPLQFTVTAQCTMAAFSPTLGACPTQPTVTWSVANAPTETLTSRVARIDATSGEAVGERVGNAIVTATSGSVSDNAAFNVIAPVVDSITVVLTPSSVALGGTAEATAIATFSNGDTGPIVVDTWTSTDTGVATLDPTIDSATTTATSQDVGTTNIVASFDNGFDPDPITGQATLTVTGVTLVDLLRVETAAGDPSGRVTVDRQIEFVAIGRFSDNSEAVIDDANITWSSSNTGIATVGTDGFAAGVTPGQVQITATRVDAPSDSASAPLLVTDTVCTTPLLAVPDGATAVEFASPLCVGCTVDNEGNIVNANTEDFATVTTTVGLLGATAGVTVAPGASPVNYTLPFPGGDNAGFIIGKPAGTLLTAEVLSQVFVETLRNGQVQESSSTGVTPLRVDLLGTTLTGGFETALVSFATSLEYDAIRLSVNSGTASALSAVQVFQACATADPPPPAAALTGVARIEPAATNLSVGATKGLVAIGSYSDGSEAPLSDADLDWVSANTAIATVNANGLVAGVTPGGVAITATLKPGVAPAVTGVNRDASSTVTVVPSVCAAPLLASAGATVTTNVSSLLSLPPAICLLCDVNGETNIIDAPTTNFGTINVPLGLLNATASVTVSSNSATDFPAGGTAGFVIARPVGQLLEAEVLSQIQVSTLLDGVVQQTSGPTVPLRADLLGTALTGGGDTALVTIQPTQPFDALRLTFVSGLVTAGILENVLQTVNVFQACSTAAPPETQQ